MDSWILAWHFLAPPDLKRIIVVRILSCISIRPPPEPVFKSTIISHDIFRVINGCSSVAWLLHVKNLFTVGKKVAIDYCKKCNPSRQDDRRLFSIFHFNLYQVQQFMINDALSHYR